jgi:hypothetical protein
VVGSCGGWPKLDARTRNSFQEGKIYASRGPRETFLWCSPLFSLPLLFFFVLGGELNLWLKTTKWEEVCMVPFSVRSGIYLSWVRRMYAKRARHDDKKKIPSFSHFANFYFSTSQVVLCAHITNNVILWDFSSKVCARIHVITYSCLLGERVAFFNVKMIHVLKTSC